MTNGRKDQISDPTGHDSTAPLTGERRALNDDDAKRISEGELIAGRYRVVRFIAQGGMGQVYEVEDRELRERVALKTIREERRVRSTETLFRREILLSRKVTHPNVCRIFDVGHHVGADGVELLFLTMELLPGETLADRLRKGSLPLDEATEILRHITSALTAAHAVGIVHRDLKSPNVILVPTDTGTRAVVTDFGLAFGARGEENRSVTASGSIVGTPAYMAPEQVEGGPVSAQTDIYSLGIVMYEMVTGTLPFDGTSALSIAAKRLTTRPQPPRERRPELPSRWQDAILACLEREPRKRPAYAREVYELVAKDAPRVRIKRLNQRSPWVRPFLAVAMLVGAVFIVWRVEHERHEALPVLIRDRGIHIGAFQVEGSESGYPLALRSALRIALFGEVPLVGSQLELGEGPDVVRLGVAGARRTSVPLELQARVRVEGRGASETLDVSLRLVDTVSGRERWVAAQRGSVLALPQLAQQLADRLRTDAKIAATPVAPPSQRLSKRLQLIIDESHRGQYAEAYEDIESALVVEPSAVELRVLQARTLIDLELDVSSKVVIERLRVMPRPADSVWQQRVELLLARTDRSRWVAAAEALYKARPHDIDAGFDFIDALTSSERKKETWEVFAALERDAAGKPLDLLRLAVLRLALYMNFDAQRRVLLAYEDVVSTAQRLKEPGLELDALEIGCIVTLVERPSHIDDVCGSTIALARKERRPNALLHAADAQLEAAEAGNTPQWGALADRYLVVAQSLGTVGSILEANDAIMRASALSHDWQKLDDAAQVSLTIAHNDNDGNSAAQLLNSLHTYANIRGDEVAAAKYLRQSLELAYDTGDTEMVAFCSIQQAAASLSAGELVSAQRELDQARASSAEWVSPITFQIYRRAVALLATEMGRPADAAAAIAAIAHDPVVEMYSWGPWEADALRMDVAHLQGNAAEVERAARAALAKVPQGAVDRQNSSDIYLAVALAEQGKAVPSEDLIGVMQKRLLDVPMEERVFDELTIFELRRLRREPTAQLLVDIDAYITAQPPTRKRHALRARLEKARVLAATKDPQAHAYARTLADDARAAGFVLIATLATQLAGGR